LRVQFRSHDCHFAAHRARLAVSGFPSVLVYLAVFAARLLRFVIAFNIHEQNRAILLILSVSKAMPLAR
jgi:hypothetical protein